MDAPVKYEFAGQTFAELPDRLVLPLPREYGIAPPPAPQHGELSLREPTEDEVTRSRDQSRAKLISLVSACRKSW